MSSRSEEFKEFKEALGADEVIPVTGLSIYQLRQRIVRLETVLRNFQKAYVEHLQHHGSHIETDPLYTLTDALYAAATDLIGD